MLNKCSIIGRLGRDPELRFTGNGTAVCKFSVATDEKWTDRDGNKQERTEWFSVIVWSKQGESCSKYLAKGSLVYVEGRIQTRTYEKDGQKRYVTELVASEVKFLSFKGDGQRSDDSRQGSGEAQPGGGGPSDQGGDDDIPFIVACDVSPSRRFRV